MRRAALEEYLEAGLETNPLDIDIAIAHGHLGLVALYEGDGDVADRHFRQSLMYARAPQARAIITETLFGMSAVAAMDGKEERALRLWGAARGVRAEMQSPLTAPEQFIIERYIEPAEADLPEGVRESARSEGAAMGLDDAVAYALSDCGDPERGVTACA